MHVAERAWSVAAELPGSCMNQHLHTSAKARHWTRIQHKGCGMQFQVPSVLLR